MTPRFLAVVMALGCFPAWGHDVTPDSVWTAPGDSLAGTIEVCWTPVHGAEGYQILRLLAVHVVDGELLDEPVFVWVPWISLVPPHLLCFEVIQTEGESPEAQWSVLALHQHATAARRRTWGAVKIERERGHP